MDIQELRLRALEFATAVRSPTDSTKEVIARAEFFLSFLISSNVKPAAVA